MFDARKYEKVLKIYNFACTHSQLQDLFLCKCFSRCSDMVKILEVFRVLSIYFLLGKMYLMQMW